MLDVLSDEFEINFPCVNCMFRSFFIRFCWQVLAEFADHDWFAIISEVNLCFYRVRTASLRGNRIEQLSADQIPDAIETLDVSANRVQHIAPATFAAKTSLRSLDLSDNRLSQLSEESLIADGVHSIDASLRGNPLRCSCELHWIKKPEVVSFKKYFELICSFRLVL